MNINPPSAAWQERRQQQFKTRSGDPRGAFERDRARVIHSAAFRRLQSKTQILGVLEGDFHRTRLTHSMEVAQIGRGLVLQLGKRFPDHQPLLPSLETIETLGLAHDLGHPPFGHGGEAALNCMMHLHGGFESNAQSLRLLGRLESHTPGFGLNLSRRAMLGVLKYPAPYSRLNRITSQQRSDLPEKSSLKRKDWVPPKCYMDGEQDILDWLLEPLTQNDLQRFGRHTDPSVDRHGKTLHQSLDTSILDLADDIAYGVHDLEDAVALKLYTREQWQEIHQSLDPNWVSRMELTNLEDDLFEKNPSSGHSRKQAVGAMVHALIQSAEIQENPEFEEPLLHWKVSLPEVPRMFLESLKDSVSRHVIQRNTVQSATFRGHRMLVEIFQVLLEEADRLLPERFGSQWKNAENESQGCRVICDYMAGMTDQYANRIYSRFFLPNEGSVFDRI